MTLFLSPKSAACRQEGERMFTIKARTATPSEQEAELLPSTAALPILAFVSFVALTA